MARPVRSSKGKDDRDESIAQLELLAIGDPVILAWIGSAWCAVTQLEEQLLRRLLDWFVRKQGTPCVRRARRYVRGARAYRGEDVVHPRMASDSVSVVVRFDHPAGKQER